MKKQVTGKVWRFGDNIDTDQMIPAEYLVTGNPVELARHAFEKTRPKFAKEVEKGDIIVAGKNFGCGSSREHAPRALIGCGIACVIAKSFARIFFRNAVNIGLPVVECDVEVEEGDEVRVNFEAGEVKNVKSGNSYTFKSLPPFLMDILSSGGLVGYTKRKLKDGK